MMTKVTLPMTRTVLKRLAVFNLPCRLTSHLNSRKHRMVRARDGAAQKRTAYLMTLANARPWIEEWKATRDPWRWHVRLTRLGQRLLDEPDNLAESAKYVKDGIAKALGLDDAKITWEIRQLPVKKALRGVVVELSRVQRMSLVKGGPDASRGPQAGH